MSLSGNQRKLLWDLVAVAAICGLIYGTVEFYQYAGPWKTLVMVPLMFVLGWMAINFIYPLWFGDD
jgi:hypothetical protein